MWLCLNEGFYSIVRTKDLPPGHLLVRARREGDLEKLWPDAEVKRTVGRDYLFRAIVPEQVVAEAVAREVIGIDYGNFKASVDDQALHDAYLNVWHAMARIQRPAPYSRG